MTDILLLGTFHFMESDIDFYSRKSQKELELLSESIKSFAPDTIAVEAAAHAQKDIDSSYEKFCLDNLNDIDKMKRENLGDIHIFGGCYPIMYNNEAVQIGYRLGKLFSHTKIYAIDDDTASNMNPMKSDIPSLAEAKKAFKLHSNAEPKDSIIEKLKYINDEKWINLHHSTYIQANAVNADSDYSGSTMVAAWYERNLKIFANIQNLAKSSKRMLVIYGAGHLKILKQLINEDSNLRLVDISEYI